MYALGVQQIHFKCNMEEPAEIRSVYTELRITFSETLQARYYFLIKYRSAERHEQCN